MKCYIYGKDHKLLRTEERTPTCNDFCDVCGDCLKCYPGGCYKAKDGQHTWVEYTKEEEAPDEDHSA